MNFGVLHQCGWVLDSPKAEMNTHNKSYVMNRKFGCSVKKKRKRGYKWGPTKFYWENSLYIKKQLPVRTSVVPVHRLQLGVYSTGMDGYWYWRRDQSDLRQYQSLLSVPVPVPVPVSGTRPWDDIIYIYIYMLCFIY
jgi:hypothetical protein